MQKGEGDPLECGGLAPLSTVVAIAQLDLHDAEVPAGSGPAHLYHHLPNPLDPCVHDIARQYGSDSLGRSGH